ncbi:MAG: NUDIX hydrolase [Gammaproteobacteria bacterium]|nr:NUDIX hydrolase [Gammaproteobacteria bacterium]
MKHTELQALRLSSMIDALVQVGYRIAYRLWRLYLRLCKRETFGAQVAVCFRQKVLLIKSSYRRTYSFPGGYLNRGEASDECASRELKEEAGLDISSAMLRSAFSTTYQCGGHRGHDEIFEITVDAVPEVSIDNREIIFAEFIDMFDALSLPLDDQVRKYIMSNSILPKGVQ